MFFDSQCISSVIIELKDCSRSQTVMYAKHTHNFTHQRMADTKYMYIYEC